MVRWTVILHECFTFVVNQLGGIERASPEDVFRLMKNQGLTISDIELYLQEYRTAMSIDPGAPYQASAALRLEIDRQNEIDIDNNRASLYTIWHAEETLRTFRMNMDISREKMRRYLNRKKLSEERRALIMLLGQTPRPQMF
ncbi:Protein PHR1-LIKE 1 [Linum perenne]